MEMFRLRIARLLRSGHIVSITAALVDQPIAGVPAALAALTKGALNAVTDAEAARLAQGLDLALTVGSRETRDPIEWAQRTEAVIPKFIPVLGDIDTDLPGAPSVAFGVVLILIMLAFPGGVAGLIRTLKSLAIRGYERAR